MAEATDVLVVIPARFGSKRFPGKPLAMIAGLPMLVRVYRQAERALSRGGRPVRGDVVVATDDERVADAARANNLAVVMTPDSCPTGSDRAFAAARALGRRPEVIVNWQGDNPCCPTGFVAAMAGEFALDASARVVTPCVRLRWADLDQLREDKKTTPFSGTFAVLRDLRPADGADLSADAPGPAWTDRPLARATALLFSKREVPAMRDEAERRRTGGVFSPLYRHIGIYAYRYEALAAYVDWPTGALEACEGLEQLRFLENNVEVRVLVMDDGGQRLITGVDSPEDIPRAEEWLKQQPQTDS